jgi:hypothetical protein
MASYGEQGAADDRAISLVNKASSALREIEGLIEDGSRRAADAVSRGAGLAGRERVADQVSEQIKFLVIDLAFVADDYVQCIADLLSQAGDADPRLGEVSSRFAAASPTLQRFVERTADLDGVIDPLRESLTSIRESAEKMLGAGRRLTNRHGTRAE